MDYLFYFSYARANYDAYLKRFFDDLSSAVHDRLGLPRSARVGYFDQATVELGDRWEDASVEALQKSRMMVSMYSPAYFRTPYCGKEWQIFQRRWQLYLQNEPASAWAPAVIYPVVWIASRGDLPLVASSLQYVVGDPNSTYNQKGLRSMLQRYNEYRSEYEDLLWRLSDRIIDASEKIHLPPLDFVPDLSQIESAFHEPGTPEQELAKIRNPIPLTKETARKVARSVERLLPNDAEHAHQNSIQVNDSQRIFISYRRGDSSGYAGRLYDRLAERFGEDQVFMDIDAIKPGENFIETIKNAVKSASVVIALLNKQWVNATDDAGQRRLNNPDDLVVLEITTALKNNIRVIPVLIQGASMPRPQDVPESLTEFVHRNAFEISDTRWKYDVTQLISFLESERK